MPIYEVYNEELDETSEVFMSYASLQEHLKENPHITLVPNAPAIVSGVSGITHKVDSGFKDVLNRIGNANPYSPLGQEYGDKGIKITKNRQAVKRQKERQKSSL